MLAANVPIGKSDLLEMREHTTTYIKPIENNGFREDIAAIGAVNAT